MGVGVGDGAVASGEVSSGSEKRHSSTEYSVNSVDMTAVLQRERWSLWRMRRSVRDIHVEEDLGRPPLEAGMCVIPRQEQG